MSAILATPISSAEQWHGLRARNVGCSEVGALFGVHDFITGFALAARKMGRLDDQIDDAVLRRGRLLEPVAVAALAELHPDWQIIKAASYYEDTAIRFGATPDLLVRNRRGLGVVQIKTVAPAVFARKWRNDAGDVMPPLWIALQAMGEQHLTGADFALVAALVIDYGLSLELIEIPYLADVIDNMRSRVVAFWELVGRGELPPPDYGADQRHLAKIYARDDGTELDLTGDNELPGIVAQFEALQMARKTAQDGIERAQAKILARIGAAQRARFAGGTITAKTINRKGYHVQPSEYRRMTVTRDRERGVDDAA